MIELMKTRTVTAINKSAVKKFALRASTELKSGKFTRVSDEFVHNVEAELERFIRSIPGAPVEDRPLVDIDSCPELITGKALKKIQPQLNLAIARFIQRRIAGMPTLGKTL